MLIFRRPLARLLSYNPTSGWRNIPAERKILRLPDTFICTPYNTPPKLPTVGTVGKIRMCMYHFEGSKEEPVAMIRGES